MKRRMIYRYPPGQRLVPMKVPPIFKARVQEAAVQRVRSGKDPHERSMARILKAMARHEPTWDDIKRADFIEDNRGQIFDLFKFMIIALMAVVFFAGLIYASGLIKNALTQAGNNNEQNYAGNACFGITDGTACSNQGCGWNGAKCVPAGYVNMTAASNATLGKMDESIQSLRLVALTLIFSLIIGFFITNSLIKVHPSFFFVYVFIVSLAVIFAAPIANAYLTLETSNIYDGLLKTFTGAGFMLENLPVVVAVTGILGGIFLFINMIRQGNEGAGL